MERSRAYKYSVAQQRSGYSKTETGGWLEEWGAGYVGRLADSLSGPMRLVPTPSPPLRTRTDEFQEACIQLDGAVFLEVALNMRLGVTTLEFGRCVPEMRLWL